MIVSPYINFAGNAREVVAYYADKLHAEVLGPIMTFGDLGAASGQRSANDHLVAHAHLKIGESHLFLSDTPPDYMTLTAGNHMSLMLQSADRETVQRVWDALASEGQVTMAIGPVPWGPLYGQVVDKFGVNWQLDFLEGA